MLGIIEKISHSILFENKYLNQESIKSSTCRMLHHVTSTFGIKHAFYAFYMHSWTFFVLKTAGDTSIHNCRSTEFIFSSFKWSTRRLHFLVDFVAQFS